MSDSTGDDRSFLELAAEQETTGLEWPAPSRLKSRIYSALVQRQAEAGPLLSLSRTEAGGRQLCVFEELVRVAPVGEQVESLNFCRICHARVLGERIERAPIYWSGCPYVRFQNR
jgi:hypothetical protein